MHGTNTVPRRLSPSRAVARALNTATVAEHAVTLGTDTGRTTRARARRLGAWFDGFENVNTRTGAR
jgi:hypothetical protein